MPDFVSDVFQSLEGSFASKGRNAFSKREFDSALDSQLKFDSLKKADPEVRISSTEFGYMIQHSGRLSMKTASQSLLGDNAIDLSFTDDMIHFTPDEDMVKPSISPLWLLKRSGPNTFSVVRAWR